MEAIYLILRVIDELVVLLKQLYARVRYVLEVVVGVSWFGLVMEDCRELSTRHLIKTLQSQCFHFLLNSLSLHFCLLVAHLSQFIFFIPFNKEIKFNSKNNIGQSWFDRGLNRVLAYYFTFSVLPRGQISANQGLTWAYLATFSGPCRRSDSLYQRLCWLNKWLHLIPFFFDLIK